MHAVVESLSRDLLRYTRVTHKQAQVQFSRQVMHSGSVLESSNFTHKVRMYVSCYVQNVHVCSLLLFALSPMNPAGLRTYITYF